MNKINITYDDEVNQYKKFFLNKTQLVRWIELVATENNLSDFEVSIYFCTDENIRKLNRDYRGLDEVTDVLSFSQLEGDSFVTASKYKLLGDIAICLPQTIRQADQDGHDYIAEQQLLLCHGMLHLLGYDHITDNGEMFALQEKILNKIRPNVV